ncbi:PBECR3 domain-containing polyvalent protein [Paenibacillus medicaginis]|uniref:PBECR2 nuclease fold domain-containing protein n=1 Tax=Paenibacillus medicaginis TaxID=1470560 RepID=A0ABV5C479_9BACL
MEPNTYTIDIHATETQIVGKLDTVKIKSLLGIDFPVAEVRMYPGAIKHIKRNHPGDIEAYGHLIPDTIANPDYIGQHPKEPNSVELVKAVTPHLLLAIKLDPSGYLYLSTFYQLDNAVEKVKKRLKSGRLVPYK